MSLKQLFISFSFFFAFTYAFFGVDSALAGCDSADDPLGLGCAAETGLNPTDPRLVVGRIISVSLGLLGTIAVALIVFAGFKWMTAAGNDDAATSAKGILFAAVIGLVIILSAYAISNFVIKELYRATQNEAYGGVINN